MKRNTSVHPKLTQLASELKIRKYAAVGLLELLWHMTAQFAPEGDIGKFQDTDISLQLDWRGEPFRLVSALVKCRWLDTDPKYRLIVHHWSAHSDSACDKYLADCGRHYADRQPPRRKGLLPLLNPPSETKSDDKSSQVTTSDDKSRLPKPIPKPMSKPLAVAVASSVPDSAEAATPGSEPAAAAEEPPLSGMQEQVQRIKVIRKEFGGLRDVDIENAFKDCPAEFRETAIADFERDQVAALKVPDMPVKILRAYLGVAARKGAGGTTSVGTTEEPRRGWHDDDGSTEVERVFEKASQALADKAFREEKAAGRQTGKDHAVTGAATNG